MVMPGRVFISHASEDRAIADAVCEVIEGRGVPRYDRRTATARALQVPDLGASAWLLIQVGVPGMSLVLGGRAIGRLWAAMHQSDESEHGGTEAATRFQVAWTAAGIVWTASAIASALLGAQGSIVIVMLVGALQCLATVVRGVKL
jgi:hypothetical protein